MSEAINSVEINPGSLKRSDLLVLIITYDSIPETHKVLRRVDSLIESLNVDDGRIVKGVVWDNKAWNLQWRGSSTYHSSDRGNVGFGPAVNSVTQLHDFQRILLINPDVELDESAFSEIVERNLTLGEEDIWAPALINSDGSVQTSERSLFMRTAMQEVVDVFGFAAKSQRRRRPLYYLRGAVFSISDRLLTLAHGFDEGFFLYGEEADLCFRLSSCANLVFDGDIAVIHHGSQGNDSKSWAALCHSYRARVLLHKKFNGPMSAAVVAVATELMKLALRAKRLLKSAREAASALT